MTNMSREEFLKLSALGLAAAAIPGNLWSMASGNKVDEELIKKLVKANDESVKRFSDLISQDASSMGWFRPLSHAVAVFTASYCHPGSMYYKSADLLKKMEQAILPLIALQYPDGLLDSGGNRQSPPDTAFTVDALCSSAVVLKQHETKQTKNVQQKLNEFLLKAGEGIRTGGVHTPNHRWAVSAVLAKLYELFEDEKYVRRVDDWLSEGIYINEDGNYPERSRNYARVETDAFITIGHLLKRPALLDIARKNLVSNYYYMEPNGELVTLDSRRQDQYQSRMMRLFYLQYRFMANHDNDAFLGAITREIETMDGFDNWFESVPLIRFMETPLMQKEVKAAPSLPTDYAKFFKESELVRIRRQNMSASIFGGTDRPVVIASGRSTNPTFFTFRKGAAVLEYARLSTSFFNTGYVRCEGVQKDGNTYTLHESKEAYYYQPLPADKRNADGDYKHTESLDGRFWSKMDFPARPKDTLTMDSTIKIVEENGAFKMDIQIDGPKDVMVTMDFCFRNGGVLEGVEPGRDKNDYILKNNGYMKYKCKDDVIEIGPGRADHRFVSRLDGELYSTHFGSIKGDGMHVYVTGVLPFSHSLIIK